MIISLNQINVKHVDPSNRGSYQYAPMKIALIKIQEQDEEIIEQIIFIESAKSSKKGDSSISMKIDQLDEGQYLIVFQVDWIMVNHNERKLIVNTYSPSDIEMKSEKSDQFDESFLNHCSYWIDTRDYSKP